MNVELLETTQRGEAPQAAPPRADAQALAPSVSVAIAGSGGSGVMTAGTLLLDAAARAGYYGLMVRTSGPQIRGGEAAALVRLAQTPVASLTDAFDLLIAVDWQNVNRFADEIALGATSVMIGDADSGEAPDVFKASGARYVGANRLDPERDHAQPYCNDGGAQHE